MADEKKKVTLFSKITSLEDALKIAKDAGNGFLVVAAIQGLIGAFLAPSIVLDALIFAVCGYFVRNKQSRAAAVIALLLSSVALVTTFMNKVGNEVGGGKNIFLAIILVIAGVRAVEATFKVRGYLKQSAEAPAAL